MQNRQRMAKQTGNAPTIAEYGATLVLEKQRELLRNIRNLDLEQGEKVSEEGELTIESGNPASPSFLSESETLANADFFQAFVNREVGLSPTLNA